MSFPEVFSEVSRGVRKFKQNQYAEQGAYPIIDQGQEAIAGYSDEETGLFIDVPAIVFGDHTRCIKYIDRPFFAGADGVKILKPRLPGCTRFWWHALKATSIENLGYSRHFKLLKAASFRVYDEARQREIVTRLDGILEQIAKVEQQIDCLESLVKSRFVEMFGDPVSSPKYSKRPIGELAVVSSGATPSRKRHEYYEGIIPWVKTGEVAAGNIDKTEEHITEAAIRDSACHVLPVGTILVAMYGQGDTRGKSAILNIEAATNQACAALVFGDEVDVRFALVFLQLCYNDLRNLSYGGNQKNLSLRIIKEYCMVTPPVSLQREFAAFVARADKLRQAA